MNFRKLFKTASKLAAPLAVASLTTACASTGQIQQGGYTPAQAGPAQPQYAQQAQIPADVAPYAGFRERSSGGPIVRGWGRNVYNNAAYEGCWGYQQWYRVNPQSGAIEAYPKVIAHYPSTPRLLCTGPASLLGLDRVAPSPSYRGW